MSRSSSHLHALGMRPSPYATFVRFKRLRRPLDIACLLQKIAMKTVKQAVGLSSGKNEDRVVSKEQQPGYKKQNQEFIGTVRYQGT